MHTTRTLALAAVLLSAGAAHAGILYSNNFESGTAPGPEWSANAHYSTATPLTRFMGRYGTTDSVTLTLAPYVPESTGGTGGGSTGGGSTGGGAESVVYTLGFDFYAIDSWDGYEPNFGVDSFQVLINGTNVFNETIANQHSLQSFRPADVGPTAMAYGSAKDSIYRDISLSFTIDPAATEIKIKFHGQLSQSFADESWGIDNVNVGYQVVPSPGSLALLVLGTVLAGRRRR